MVEAQKKSVKVGKLVNTAHVDTAIKNYKRERWVQNSERLGKEDSLSVWYSVKELQQFLEMAKDHGADGIRMYFGAYSEDYADQPLFAGRQTVMLVATKEKETADGTYNKDVYINTDKGTSILAYNAGRLCPPLCSGFGDGGYDEIGITIVDKGDKGMVVA
ncbi:MAG: hypothetical protein JNL59_13830 [Chitinophagaceae bacterium]|nr:hypothetical protein [Chitinophagaceae bacterium]